MSQRTDPAALRWLIGGEMARLREHSGLSLLDVARKSGVGKTKIGHMEVGRYNQDPADIRSILTACETPESEIERLRSIATKPVGRAWWHRWRSVVSDWLGLYLGLEGMATSLFAYELTSIHGLVQTRRYAEAITTQGALVEPENVDRHVRLRMARAERLTVEPLLNYHLVLDESALQRSLGESSLMVEQIEHLLDVSRQPNVTLQVMPFDRALHAGASLGNYAILDFDVLAGVVYSELYDDALFIREPAKLKSYRMAAKHSIDTALSPTESRSLLEARWKELA